MEVAAAELSWMQSAPKDDIGQSSQGNDAVHQVGGSRGRGARQLELRVQVLAALGHATLQTVRATGVGYGTVLCKQCYVPHLWQGGAPEENVSTGQMEIRESGTWCEVNTG